jgi:2-dehydropantoate 2-reductase
VLKPVQAIDDPSQVGKVDLVIVGVKAWQVPEAAEDIRPMIGPQTMALRLQNGPEAPAQVAEKLGGRHVHGANYPIISLHPTPRIHKADQMDVPGRMVTGIYELTDPAG